MARFQGAAGTRKTQPTTTEEGRMREGDTGNPKLGRSSGTERRTIAALPRTALVGVGEKGPV